ncbi:MAG TPA: heme-binding protein [Candidatus Angelobacter sp.]|nr:heme-binding protein [Candidatus Angelobacter sp.]
MSDPNLKINLNMTADFKFAAVRADHLVVAPPPPTAPLGPLAAFVGDWAGQGFNTIFRPDSTATPTPLPFPITGSDNILELNLTSETLSFSPPLGAIPNRGTDKQGDITLNGVPYLQKVNDITIHGESVGIHFEPGMWIHVPATTVPPQGETVARMASIPHGTTIEAQGTFVTFAGPPKIDPVDITPFAIAPPHSKVPFPSQKVINQKTARIPQDLTSFIAAGTITQAILDDPNKLLRDHISKQKITQTTAITINTAAPPVPFGGGTDNIAFLQGQAGATAPNANAVQMTAVFWIETVEEVITVPPFKLGQPPHLISAQASVPGQRAAQFSVTPPFELNAPRKITVHFTQIQYTQTVMLNFKGLTWPHVSVNTLVPANNVVVPPSAWGS